MLISFSVFCKNTTVVFLEAFSISWNWQFSWCLLFYLICCDVSFLIWCYSSYGMFGATVPQTFRIRRSTKCVCSVSEVLLFFKFLTHSAIIMKKILCSNFSIISHHPNHNQHNYQKYFYNYYVHTLIWYLLSLLNMLKLF